MEITHQTPGRLCALNGIQEVQDLQAGMDFRLPQYRREVFLRFYEHQLQYRAFPGCVYFMFPFLNKKHNLTREQKLWLAFINGNTQNIVTSWIIFQRFPDYFKMDGEAMRNFFGQNYNRLFFDIDRRHHKKNFIAAVDTYGMLTNRNQVDYFSSFLTSSDPYDNFRKAWNVVMDKFYSFGRLSSFSYLEYLRIQKLNLDCDQLFLDDMSGSKSHRNGLAKVLGRDDLDWHKSNPTGFEGKYTKEMLQWLELEASLLLAEAKQRFAGKDYEQDVSFFTLESTFCTYKSWHRPNRRYPNVYVDMFHDRIKKAEAAWPEDNFSDFWEARKKVLPSHLLLEENPNDSGVKPQKQNHYRLTGEVIMMDKEWPCFKNSFNDSMLKTTNP